MYRHLGHLLIGLLFFLAMTANAAEFDHTQWDILLAKYVRVQEDGKKTSVNYGGIAEEKAALTGYLKQLTRVTHDRFDQWPKAEQLAFLINAYNARTVELILTKYPDLKSIKDLGSLFRSPWKKKFFSLLGEKRSLDDLEHGMIRGAGRYNDPRIHFALNCASLGCPALKNQAYRGDILEEQLEEATILFLSDRSRNRLNDNILEISSLFKWYRQDFESGWRGAKRLPQLAKLKLKHLLTGGSPFPSSIITGT